MALTRFQESKAIKQLIRAIKNGSIEYTNETDFLNVPRDEGAKHPYFEPLRRNILNVIAYGEYGIIIDTAVPLQERLAFFEDQITQLDQFLEFYEDEIQDGVAENAIEMARARVSLDRRRPLTYSELYALTKRKTFQQSGFSVKEGKRSVTFKRSKALLKSFNDFFDSIWHLQTEELGNLENIETPGRHDNYPCTRRGEIFHKGLGTNDKFYVGTKGGEIKIFSWGHALRHLRNTPDPVWYRLMTNGTFIPYQVDFWAPLTTRELKEYETDIYKRFPVKDLEFENTLEGEGMIKGKRSAIFV